jgi:rod shape-determining protein MreC
LYVKNLQLQGSIKELASLRRLLKFETANPKLNLLATHVIGNCPENTTDPCIFIDRGYPSGLRVGMTVVDPGGFFVGAIADVTRSEARVTLMLNPSLSVGAVDQETGAKGLVEGQYAAKPIIKDVRTLDSLRPGDWIVTSGEYALFPRGLPLGQVTAVQRGEAQTFQSAQIQPAADFAHLEIAAVVSNFKPNYPASLING